MCTQIIVVLVVSVDPPCGSFETLRKIHPISGFSTENARPFYTKPRRQKFLVGALVRASGGLYNKNLAKPNWKLHIPYNLPTTMMVGRERKSVEILSTDMTFGLVYVRP